MQFEFGVLGFLVEEEKIFLSKIAGVELAKGKALGGEVELGRFIHNAGALAA